jgi:hypothetical protein
MTEDPHPRISRRAFLKAGLAFSAGAALTAGTLASYPLFIERHWIQINRYPIPVPHLPAAFEGFRIAHLSDLHYGPLVSLSFISRVLKLTQQCAPDLIVFTGDFVHSQNTRENINTLWPMLSELEARWGVFSVPGNHDYWADIDRTLYWMKKTGQDLYKTVIPLIKQGERIWLGGTGDHWEDHEEIDRIFQAVPEADCRICLAHNPDTADQDHQTRIDLFLCGHTHGGQIRWPFLNRPFSPNQLPVKNKAYDQGYIEHNDKRLFISRGIGWAVLPIRFSCPPEIAILELTRDSSGSNPLKPNPS